MPALRVPTITHLHATAAAPTPGGGDAHAGSACSPLAELFRDEGHDVSSMFLRMLFRLSLLRRQQCMLLGLLVGMERFGHGAISLSYCPDASDRRRTADTSGGAEGLLEAHVVLHGFHAA